MCSLTLGHNEPTFYDLVNIQHFVLTHWPLVYTWRRMFWKCVENWKVT